MNELTIRPVLADVANEYTPRTQLSCIFIGFELDAQERSLERNAE